MCCLFLPAHDDHLTWAESAAALGKPFAVRCKPFTDLPSQTAPYPIVEASVVTTMQRVTMPMGAAAEKNRGVLQIARDFLHLESTVTLW